MRILLAFVAACSAPDVREPQPILGARLVCSDVSPSCFGDIHATFYATPESRERVVVNVLESLPGATLDESGTINWRDASIDAYEPASASDWFRTNCELRDGERTIIDVGWVAR